MESFERDYHDDTSDFDDRFDDQIEWEGEIIEEEIDEIEPLEDEDNFYRHLEDY